MNKFRSLTSKIPYVLNCNEFWYGVATAGLISNVLYTIEKKKIESVTISKK